MKIIESKTGTTRQHRTTQDSRRQDKCNETRRHTLALTYERLPFSSKSSDEFKFFFKLSHSDSAAGTCSGSLAEENSDLRFDL
jgi:hypothetical protein